MNTKQMFKQFSVAVLLFSTTLFSACDDTSDIEKVDDTSFNILTNLVYCTAPVIFVASDTTGCPMCTWDFGDGNISHGRYKITHKYDEPGNYNVTLSIGNQKFSKTINVRDGNLSYQIRNESSYFLWLSSYVDDMNNGSYREVLNVNPGMATDSMFVYGTCSLHQNLFEVAITVYNQIYLVKGTSFINRYQHNIFTITDSTLFIKRNPSVLELDSVYNLKGLFKY
ncbi:MAG: PKD domain-containing protein [Bacteroidales bacterium]|nr:PKD domain-containing protein [Bacteroidales bacterium]MDD3906944.1 PKD domain-containing protein [Bacteroidales bacterium]MDD4711799.1 PKD domain-containing protein [Bacteroidales bacterium]